VPMPERGRRVAYDRDAVVQAHRAAALTTRGRTWLRLRDDEYDAIATAVLSRTPLHELVDLCREQGLALDFSIYGPDEQPLGDDTLSTYVGGARITGHKGDPMDVIRAGICARRDAGEEVRDAG
jgi:hypothetical protein